MCFLFSCLILTKIGAIFYKRKIWVKLYDRMRISNEKGVRDIKRKLAKLSKKLIGKLAEKEAVSDAAFERMVRT